MKVTRILIAAALAMLLFGCTKMTLQASSAANSASASAPFDPKYTKTDAEWKKILPPATYYVTRQKGTEAAFSGKYAESKGHGIYVCADCGNELFSSDTKFDSGTGWPSFWQPLNAKTSIRTASDTSLFEERTEVICNRCGAHLGHVFNDGPKPTGLRYCMNSVALKFIPKL